MTSHTRHDVGGPNGVPDDPNGVRLLPLVQARLNASIGEAERAGRIPVYVDAPNDTAEDAWAAFVHFAVYLRQLERKHAHLTIAHDCLKGENAGFRVSENSRISTNKHQAEIIHRLYGERDAFEAEVKALRARLDELDTEAATLQDGVSSAASRLRVLVQPGVRHTYAHCHEQIRSVAAALVDLISDEPREIDGEAPAPAAEGADDGRA